MNVAFIYGKNNDSSLPFHTMLYSCPFLDLSIPIWWSYEWRKEDELWNTYLNRSRPEALNTKFLLSYWNNYHSKLWYFAIHFGSSTTSSFPAPSTTLAPLSNLYCGHCCIGPFNRFDKVTRQQRMGQQPIGDLFITLPPECTGRSSSRAKLRLLQTSPTRSRNCASLSSIIYK